MNEQTELLREMCDLLRIIAEPGLAKRDEKRRTALSAIVGKSSAKAKAVLLMDGSKNQAAIRKDAAIDQGALSRLTKTLREEGLIAADEKHPKLVLPIPANFFDNSVK